VDGFYLTRVIWQQVYYFEAVELLKTDKRHKENHLALCICPTDAAKFLCANESKVIFKASIHTLITRTAEISQDPDNTCVVNLAGNAETLTFSPTHLLDFKAILSL
jgi:hypothetical protein